MSDDQQLFRGLLAADYVVCCFRMVSLVTTAVLAVEWYRRIPLVPILANDYSANPTIDG